MNQCRYGTQEEVIYMDPTLVDAMKDNKNPLHNKVKDAIQLFHWQLKDDKHRITLDPFDEITYYIHHWNQDTTNDMNYILDRTLSVWNRGYCVFDSNEDFEYAMALAKRDRPYTWSWKYNDNNPGYEVTSKGDRRYSPFFQRVKDYEDPTKMITAEEFFLRYLKPHYQNGTKPPIRGRDLMKNYFVDHPGLMFELAIIGRRGNFTDMFDRDGGQNLWFANMLNQYYGFQ